MNLETHEYGGSISFGPFRLFPAARLLERHGQPLALGNRALDILIVLVEHAGEVVDQRELLSRVWRGRVVSPGNLRVHISALRKALTDSAGEGRYIVNVTGQGYCFVVPIQRRMSLALVAANSVWGSPPVERAASNGYRSNLHDLEARMMADV